jgi:hypothetical protein
MSTKQLETNNASLPSFATGILCFILSLLSYSQRYSVAAVLFGAHFFFGVPLTGDDSLKLLFVGLGSLVGLLMSLALIAAGAIVFARASKPENGTEGATTIPTHR